MTPASVMRSQDEVRALLQFHDAIVLDHGRAPFLGRASVSPDSSCGVDIAFAVGPHASEHPLHIDDGAAGLDFLRRHQADVINPDGLETAVRRLQPLPALRGRSDMNAAGHMHPDGLAGFALDLLQKVDRIGLEQRHIRVGVESMKTAGGVPGRASGQNGALHQRDVGPTQFCQMVKNRSTDDASADDNDAIVRFHLRTPCQSARCSSYRVFGWSWTPLSRCGSPGLFCPRVWLLSPCPGTPNMRMHDCLRRSQGVAAGGLKAVACAVNEDLTAGVEFRFKDAAGG